ncbi:MAG: permease, partial [Cellulomonas sp.]|nr:permease [Cellulomonas sp.]
MSVAERLRAKTPVRRWVGLGAATAMWFALYQVNLPVWDWVVYTVMGLDAASQLGSG